MKTTGRGVYFTLALCCAVLFIVYLTNDLGRIAGMVPSVVALFTLALLVVRLIVDVFHVSNWKSIRRFPQQMVELVVAQHNEIRHITVGEKTVRSNRQAHALLVVAAVPVLVVVFGMYLTVLGYLFWYLKSMGQLRWISSMILSVSCSLTFYWVFDRMLQVFLYQGLLVIWMGR